MKSRNIKYNLSTDYNRLKQLLDLGYMIVAYGGTSPKVSKLCEITRFRDFKWLYDFGCFGEVKEDNFDDFCKLHNIRFFDIPNF